MTTSARGICISLIHFWSIDIFFCSEERSAPQQWIWKKCWFKTISWAYISIRTNVDKSDWILSHCTCWFIYLIPCVCLNKQVQCKHSVIFHLKYWGCATSCFFFCIRVFLCSFTQNILTCLRGCTPSPKPPMVPKPTHQRRTLSAVEACGQLFQARNVSVTSFKNCRPFLNETQETQEREQETCSPQVGYLSQRCSKVYIWYGLLLCRGGKSIDLGVQYQPRLLLITIEGFSFNKHSFKKSFY